MKQIKVYPLATRRRAAMQFMNGSNQSVNTVFPDTLQYFELLAMLVNRSLPNSSIRLNVRKCRRSA